MRKSTNKRSTFIFLILIILITAFIFSNSLKNGEESNTQSEPIVEAVEKVLDPKDKIPTKTFNHVVRKAAHIAEYTLLGLALGGQVWYVGKLNDKHKRWYIIATLFTGLAIASIDEIIQSFTGRTNSVSDVLIDFTGVIIGMGIVLLLWRWRVNGAKEVKPK